MHRMRHYVAVFGVVSGTLALLAGPASAGLIKPDAKRAYPDIAADINGQIEYDYDEATETGVFTMTNTPFLIAGGESASSEFAVLPNASGVRKQFLRLKLDSQGNILDDPINTYELHGQIDANGQSFTGLLLQGTPTAFGSLDLGPVAGSSEGTAPSLGVDIFDANLDIADGDLARFFGDTAYLRITPELESTFEGSFTEDFTALKATSNIRSYDSPEPFPIPEPSTVAVLLAGGVGLLYRRHSRRRRADA